MLIPATMLAQGRSEHEREDIFILSSHTESSEWAQNMLFPINEIKRERPDLKVSLHHLQLLSHESVAELEQSVDSVLNAHVTPPRLVIILGGSAFNFTKDIDEKWPGIPIILTGEQDYFCDTEYTLLGPGNPLARRHSITLLRNQGVNVTLISAPPMIRRTVEMMLDVQPDLNKIIFVAGENYMCKERQWRLECYLQMHHPDIDYRVISSANTTTDRLLSILERENKPQTAVFYGSWLTRDGYHLTRQHGRYIAACTWFETLIKPVLGKSVLGNGYRLLDTEYSITAKDARLCQKCAVKAVKEYRP